MEHRGDLLTLNEAGRRCRCSPDTIRRRIEDGTITGVPLHFDTDPAMTVHLERFVRDEKGCCQFWGFEITETATALTLRWDGPPDVQTFLDELDAYFRSVEPLDAFSGLL